MSLQPRIYAFHMKQMAALWQQPNDICSGGDPDRATGGVGISGSVTLMRHRHLGEKKRGESHENIVIVSMPPEKLTSSQVLRGEKF
ncbi:hypothetical protein L2E82_32741 [Cichorium intybus]|uniref:Uncharacterized protein n=1 Tax=Cichorium intybus TaxID=13427 RepID=A0ACB9BI08_CICIN|nr:hypothetical protein L2E82_32741 [Cichorium intybus]